MAVNPYFPANYNPIMNPYQAQAMQNYQQTAQQGSLIWVQGIEGAKSHPVLAGQSALLLDSESDVFYIKTVDASGMPLPLRIFDYSERKESVQKQPDTSGALNIDTSSFITREEFEKRIADFLAEIERKDSQRYHNASNNTKKDGERINGK